MTPTDHPDDEEIAAFLDGGLSAVDRSRVVQHLAGCHECRALLGVVDDSVVPQASRGTGGGRRWLGLSAAAAAVLVVGVALRAPRLSAPTDQLRDNANVAVETPALVPRSPSSGASVSTDTLAFVWSPTADDVTYDVSVVDAAGALVWSTRVDTAGVALPADIRARLQPGRTYYWRADALYRDLRTASTGPQGFVPLDR